MKFLFVHLSIKDVLHSVSVSVFVPMCSSAGLTLPSQPLIADLSYDERFLVWTLLIESAHPASHVTRELQSRPFQTPATEITCLGATSCLSGPSPHLGASTGE